MGQEARCEVRCGRRVSTGKALLESSEILFRGDFKLAIPFKDIRRLDASDGRLVVEYTEGRASFGLGPLAEKWAAKIRNPRGLMDKLGVKADSKVGTLGLRDAGLLADLRARSQDVVAGAVARGRDVVLVGLESRADLAALTKARAAIHKSGAVWAVWPKGRPELREDDVRAYAREHGLVDVKVASVSQALSGLKLVIPVKER
jgi:hypothetical protein